ncbi:MAG TPA: bifunctional adenosylcobinamide kinase/adenosylcobinamide-phosphate guanylyltransferase [Actinomycetota bacterium]
MGLSVLLGGARSGKSDLSGRLATASGRPVVVIVTGEARDEEMTERIRRHRAARPSSWETVEAPRALREAVRELDGGAFAVLDCLTLWVSNLIEAGVSDDEILDEAREIATTLAERDASSVVVTNEVGLGIVPMHELARRYRDTLGRVNAAFVSEAQHAYLVVAGRALSLEGVMPT